MIDLKKLKSTVEEKITSNDRTIIVPHTNPDFDAIGSALGLSLIVKKLKKESKIVIHSNLSEQDRDPGVEEIINSCINNYNIINVDGYNKIANPDDLYFLTDVNKRDLIGIGDYITNPDNTIIIDHHDVGKTTIETPNTFIDTSRSSASEIVTYLIKIFNIKSIPSDIANYLYAGIYLDTARLGKNTTEKTHSATSWLMHNGATISRVNELFKEDMISDLQTLKLIGNLKTYNFSFGIIAGNEDEKYSKIQLAKAADYALRYGLDAIFSVGKLENGMVAVSARSEQTVNVGEIMSSLGGGGSQYSGAVNFPCETVENVTNELKRVLRPSYYLGKNNNEKKEEK